MIKCYHCGQTKPTSKFYVDRTKKSGYQSRCKDCGNLIKNVHRFNKNSGLSLSIEEYINSSGYTDDNCSICGVEYSNNSTATVKVLDHCHKTGKIRGFICSRCNLVMGHVGDNTEILDKIKKYLTTD